MLKALTMILILGAGFVAFALSLAAGDKTRLRLIAVAGSIAFSLGIFFYGYGYAFCYGISVVSVLRAFLALCRMLTGGNDLASIQSAPLFERPLALTLFWVGHFCAYYMTAGAVLLRFGEGLLYSIRVRRLRRGPLLLIYGVNANSLAYGAHMKERGEYAVLFTDKNCTPAQQKEIHAMGAVLEREEGADRLTGFLRRIGMEPRHRRLLAAAMQPDGRQNLVWARALREALSELSIGPERAALLICSGEEEAQTLQDKDGKGFGSVFAFDLYMATVHMLLSAAPPWKMISFDGAGRAEMDFHCAMVGFGRMGRAMLFQLILNTPFAGSRFTADIFDPLAENGMLLGNEILTDCAVRFHRETGKSKEFYSFLQEAGEAVRCIVICTGSRTENEEIAEDLLRWYGGLCAPTLLLSAKEGATVFEPDGRKLDIKNEFRDIEKIDMAAIRLNGAYAGAEGEEEILAAWKNCSYFSRMSSRAAVGFLPAYLYMSGRTREQVLSGDWPPPPEMLENLAETEHLLWCAYHRLLGYRRMTGEEWDARAARYRREAAETGHSSLHIEKNTEGKTHACLIPWKELDALSQRERAVTGKQVDYRQRDRDDIIRLPEVLRTLSRGAETNDTKEKAIKKKEADS